MLINNRLIWKSGAALKDLSIAINNLYSGSAVVPFVASTDKLYIGSDLPFNHRHFKVDQAAPNDQASLVTVDVWDGHYWNPAVDVIDQTMDDLTGTKTLNKSGIISWQTDKNKTWGNNSSTELMTGSGLETLKIYNMYWVRLSFSANLNTLTALKYMGHKFSRDSDLGGYYPDLNRSNVLNAFQAGKTSWDEQHVLAGEEIVRDLRKNYQLWNANQIFVWDEFTDASVHKVAEIAFTAFGKDYESRKEDARHSYTEALNKVVMVGVDKNEDGKLDEFEKRPSYGRLCRR